MLTNINCFLQSALGIIFVYYLSSFLKVLYRNTILPLLFSHRYKIKKYGNWAIVTGATDGIGKAFAEQLANDGLNLVLISRTESKLEDVRKSILSKHSNIQVKIIVCDFTKTGENYETISKELSQLQVGLLVNNVGMASQFPDYLSSENNDPKGSIVDLINCNCISASYMTHILLNTCKMQVHGGYIINVSSGAGVLHVPFLSVYSASKAFVDCLSNSLISELRHTNVFIQNVSPLVVATKMSRARPSLFAPSAENYANSVLNRIGTCRYTQGCFTHELQYWLMSCAPRCVLDKVVYTATLKLRDRALKKLVKNQ